jgi:hypothetical protein
VSQIILHFSHSPTRTRLPPVHYNGSEQKRTKRGELAQHIREVEYQHANDIAVDPRFGTAAVPDNSTAAAIAISGSGRPVPSYRHAVPPLPTRRAAVTTATSKISHHGAIPGATGAASVAVCWGQQGAVVCEGGIGARTGDWEREGIVDGKRFAE